MESNDAPDSDGPAWRCCIIHVSNKPSEKKQRCNILPFDEKNWRMVQAAAEKRRSKPQFANSVYYDVVVRLPNSNDETRDGYHVSCYQKFTAVTSPTASVTKCTRTDIVEQSVPHLRSTNRTDDYNEMSSSGIFPPNCIFCRSKRKRKKDGTVELLGACETLEAAKNIQDAADVLQDKDITSKVIGIDLVAKEAKYHHTCKSTFLLRADRTSRTGAGVSIIQQNVTIALKNIHDYIEKSVIVDKRAELLTSLYDRYLDYCSFADEAPMHKHSLRRNIMASFGTQIKVHSQSGKKLGSIVFNANAADDSIRIAYDYSESEERILNKAALILRKEILNSPQNDIPENPTLNDVRNGDISVPQPVKNFFKVLYSGKLSDQCGKRVQRHIDSSSQDALFMVHRGKVKPAEHVTLAMALKSITGSKKLVQVLNRFGHCINYNCLEELETATAEAIQERKKACPEDTLPGLPMGLAFDNFDELTQTLSGSNTLHDTMGILYQNLPDDDDQSVINHTNATRAAVNTASTPGMKKTTKKKRSLNSSDVPLEPYIGVPKMTIFNYKDTSVFSLPDVSIRAKHLDFMWMISHALEVGIFPMWVGFNSIFYKDNLPKQTIRYMPNMKEPITSLAVVRQTLETTQKCAEECNQEYGIVTYDLNAAKPAMQIQVTESPRFDNVFIMLGAFHIEMTFFKALGKLIAESDGPDMLTETGVIAPGSLNGVLTGKHFNRCKRIHPLLAFAFESLHFKAFLKTCDFEEDLRDLMSMLPTSSTEGYDVGQVTNTDRFRECAKQYTDYKNATLSGAHGHTAQFWMMYVEYINLFHRFERSIRTNDLELFIFSLTPIIDLFFATAHVNYSRWLTKFQLDLMNIDDTHPGLKQILGKGAFTVRRTAHDFSRIPVDLTLEQTINADAASRLTGITAFTNDYSARLRWMITKSTRASFITLLHEMAGMITKEDVTGELQPKQIQRDGEDLRKIIKHICDTNNPFDINNAPETLYNISTGKGASEEIKQSLLAVPTKGKARHEAFINSCKLDPHNFEKPIKREKLKTFEDGCATNRRTKNNAIAALKGTRNLMGRLLVLASKRSLDLQYVLQYPLTTVPLSMATPDEVMTKTNKSSLFGVLENTVKDHGRPDEVSVFIIDGQFLLHSMPTNLPPTYGGLARSILIQSLRTSAKYVHIVFDDYPQPSIKDAERDKRGADSRTFVITGPEQRRAPRDLNDALKSRSFKIQLPKFLAHEWQDPSYVHIFKQQQVVLDVPGECYHFKVEDNMVHRDTVDILHNNHEEADTNVCFHALSTDNDDIDIVIRASDTDIAVILLYHCTKFQSRLWMDVGTAAKNNRRYINISAICHELGPNLCAALPAFHSFTGSDYTSSFVRRGKVRPFKILEKRPDYQSAFKMMTKTTLISEATKASLLDFTASIYGAKDNTGLNNYRYQKFMQSYGPKGKGKNLLSNLRGTDASGLPPCEGEVSAHIKRASFVAKM